MSKKLFTLLISFVILLSTPRLAIADVIGSCGIDPICPAPVGECISGGPWKVGESLITLNEEYCRCSSSNIACSVAGAACSFYDPSDPYAPESDDCECIPAGDTFCDATWWTYCCTPGPEVTVTPTPTDPPSSTPTPTPTFYISGSIQQDVDAAAAGSYCAQSTPKSLSLTGLNISLLNTAHPTTTYPTISQAGNYSFTTSTTGNTYTVTLDLSGQTGVTDYVCSCPAPIDPDNPYLCRYTGVGAPSSGVNFYLKEYNLSNSSWFQIFGGNLFSRYNIASSVPYTFCATDASCQAALLVPPVGSNNKIASGFAVNSLANSGSIVSSSSEALTHSYLTLADRTNNVNSYSLNTDINQLSYDYFDKLAGNSIQEVGDGSYLVPLFSTWTGSSWWSTTEVNYVKVNGNLNISEFQNFKLTSSQKLVVLVDGNLTIDDSDPNDSNRKITSVANGGFLAFFVHGNITITPDVGYALDPEAVTVPTVSITNSNVEGIFVADGDLTIASKADAGETLPDRKFIGAGTFVGWTSVNLDRTFDDGNLGPILNNNQAVENFIYRPDLLANWPTKLKASLSNWREVDPQLINQ